MCSIQCTVAFGASTEDKKQNYVTFIGSFLDQSADVWGSSWSVQNARDLERCQKNALQLIDSQYSGYKTSPTKLYISEISNI